VPLIFVTALLISREPAPETVATETAPPPVETRAVEPRAVLSAPGPDAAVPVADAIVQTAPVIENVPIYESLRLTVKPGDTLDALFRKHGLSLADLAAIAALPEAKRPLRLLKPGDVLELEHEAGRLRSLHRNLNIEQALHVERSDESGYTASIVERPIEIRQSLVHGQIQSSLFESAAAAGLSDKVIMNVAGIFAWDIDFVLDIRSGDEYYVMFEEIWQDGEKVSDGEIVAAEFINRGTSYRALRYVSPEGDSDYFGPDGRSVRKAFVRAPVDFTRISSNFNPNRRHPILNKIRAHRGVDYAAPGGTPIKAAGDGKIIFRGKKSGYGNVVILQHGGNITTLYAHMSNFHRGQRIGTRVKQGQVIGFVGRTGLATANHLHYEYRLNGVHRNPRTVELPAADPIDPAFREDFLRTSAPILQQLERFKATRLASLPGPQAGQL
jgi:murein DD-endopeptidase MepM/ murein hydrolase activator NlpD